VIVSQGHEFIDVELRTSRDLHASTAANQREALNDVTTTSYHPERDDVVDATDNDDDADDVKGCWSNCCASVLRISVCCQDDQKHVSFIHLISVALFTLLSAALSDMYYFGNNATHPASSFVTYIAYRIFYQYPIITIIRVRFRGNKIYFHSRADWFLFPCKFSRLV